MRPILSLLLLSAAVIASPAAAFMFSDGTTMQCTARGQVVPETYAPAGDPFESLGRVGLAARSGDGYRITWNAKRLAALPPETHDFIFFHECAHAQIPTEIELAANCAGLLAMRRAGRAGPAVENKLRALFGGHPHWEQTVRCADEEDANAGRGAAPAAKGR